MRKAEIEKLVFGGQGLSKIANQAAFIWNALPGEIVEAEIFKKKKDYLEGLAKNIITPSPHRILPAEEHFLSCSPWQILSWEQENIWKEKIAQEILKRDDLKIIFDSREYGYRHKMEYSFTKNREGEICLAFYRRGTHRLIPANPCKLAKPEINTAAETILAWLKANHIPATSLKSLIVRSPAPNRSHSALFIKERFKFSNLPRVDNLQIFYSDPKNPAANCSRLCGRGEFFLKTRIKNTELEYHLLSFFQINPPLFEKTLEDIGRFLDPQKVLIDYFAGVGAISLPLSDQFREAILVESQPQSAACAEKNIKANALFHCSLKFLPSEKALEFINRQNIILLNPPRAGLHPAIIKKLLAEKPLRIIYLSCNLASQNRDIRLLEKEYKISFWRLYNFFPKTAHIEGLCVLDRICK